MPFPILGAISGAIGLGKALFGGGQNRKADTIDRNNPFPTMPLQQEYQQNVNTAQNMAQVGTPQVAYNNQLNAINRNQGAGVMALSRAANPGSGIASIVRASNDATGRLNSEDALARNRALLGVLAQKNAFATAKNGVWDWNSRQKFLNFSAKANALRGAGNANINSGLSDIGGTATNMMFMNQGYNPLAGIAGRGGSPYMDNGAPSDYSQSVA